MNKKIKYFFYFYYISIIISIIIDMYIKDDDNYFINRLKYSNILFFFFWIFFNIFYYISTDIPLKSVYKEIDIPHYKKLFICLKKNYNIIKQEYSKYPIKGFRNIQGDGFFGQRLTTDGKWKSLYLIWPGRVNKHIINKYFKNTYNILKKQNVKLALLSRLEPGAIITPHFGIFKGTIRVHLGIDIPNKSDGDCYIRIDGIKWKWMNGKLLIFDDTYLHCVKNKTNKTRTILFMDILRPLNNPISKIIGNIINNIISPFIELNENFATFKKKYF